jgi:exocyst complex protein 7
MALITSTVGIQATYATLMAPINSMFTTTLTLLLNLIKTNLNKHGFMALAAYEDLQNVQPAWNEVQMRTGKKDSGLKETLTSLRGICLRSFPEFLLDVRGAATKSAEVGTGIHETTNMVINYLQQIPQVVDAVGLALLDLGDGMWKMGEGAPKVFEKSDQDDQRVLIERFVCELVRIKRCLTSLIIILDDVVTALLSSLNAIATSQKKPAQASTFLFNNVAYLRTKLLLDPVTPIDDLLGKATQDSLNSNFRTAKAGYFDANFSPMIQSLGDAGGKRDVKDKLTRFFDALDEAGDRHRVCQVLPDDEDGKEMLQEEVVRLVVPALKRFNEKNVASSKSEYYFRLRDRSY